MKRILFAVLLLTGLNAIGQDDIEKVQQAWKKDKKELVRIGMELNATDSVKFWPIYDKYEVERQKLGRERILALNDYADNYFNITNAKADEIINKIFKNDAALAKLQQDYYGKVKTAVNAMTAAKFMHVEAYLQSTIRSMIQGALPAIGQLDSLKVDKM